MELAYINRIYARNFVSDFASKLKNVIGGRLKNYEKLIDDAVEDAFNAFKQKYKGKDIKNIKVDTEEFTYGAILVTITGEY